MADGSRHLTGVKVLFWLVATGALLAFVIGKWDQVNEVSAGDFSLRIRAEVKQPAPANPPVDHAPPAGPAPAAHRFGQPPGPPQSDGQVGHYQNLLERLYRLRQAEQLQTEAAEQIGRQLMSAYQTQLWGELQGQQQDQQMLQALLPFLQGFSQQ